MFIATPALVFSNGDGGRAKWKGFAEHDFVAELRQDALLPDQDTYEVSVGGGAMLHPW